MRSFLFVSLAAWVIATLPGCTPSPAPKKQAAAAPGTVASDDAKEASGEIKSNSREGQILDTVKDVSAPEEDSSQQSAPADKPMPSDEPSSSDNADADADTAQKPVTKQVAEAAREVAEAAEDAVEVLLGTGELTSGIPGEGPLKLEEIEAFLADPKNHQVLSVKLPLGLSAGQGAIVGLKENPLTRAKIELGRQLYFDPRLSADGTVSCAECHHPDEGYARATQFGVGIGKQTGNRNSPASYNRILSGPQFWDGRAATLEEQAKGPIANPIEMGNTHEVCVDCLNNIPGYKVQFEKIFEDGVNIENVAKAIASFERAIVTNPSPYDYYEPLRVFEKAYESELEDLEEFKDDDPEAYEEYLALKKASDEHPISQSAKRGREIFFSQKGGCTACHVGPNFTDEKYHNIGVGMDAEKPDLGRYEVTKDEKDRGAFKTPTVRNVALTAPYMHDGSQKTLEEVVEWYNKGGHPNPNLSKDIRKLNLTDQEKKDLVEFMKALTGEFTPVEVARLPE